MMHDEEEKGLVNDDVPLRNISAPHKRKRYLLALCAFVGFIVFLVTVIHLDKNQARSKGFDDMSSSLVGETPEQKQTSEETDPLELGQDISEDDEDEINEELGLKRYARKCAEKRDARDKGTLQKDSVEYSIAAADCGWGYDYNNSAAKTAPWKVVLFGPGWSTADISLSGCPVRAKCPLSPRCQIVHSTDAKQLGSANVAVIIQHDANDLVGRLTSNKKRFNVLNYREAHLTKVYPNTQRKFDFIMGVHYFSELLNPFFPRTPSQLLSSALEPFPPIEFIPLQKRPYFAMSAISDCGASSQRDRYIDLIAQTIGKERVHRYGKCGDRKMPEKPINNAAKLIAQYKFYFSFENTFQTGYVTEKLFWILNLPVLPVYYGTPNAPNITSTPSYIRATDFSSPTALAKYLLHLEANEDEYMAFHKWRKDPSQFTKDYLDTLAYKIAGPEEQLQYPRKIYRRFPRTAQCCRLCDRNYVEWAAKQRAENTKKPVAVITQTEDIYARYFEG